MLDTERHSRLVDAVFALAPVIPVLAIERIEDALPLCRALVDNGYAGALARVASEDSFIPLGDAALTVLLSEDQIEAAARKLAS